jgi:hypothetical protein
MEENEKKEIRDQGIIKTLASPTLLAAILDQENSTEISQNGENLSCDHLTEKTLNTSQQNNDSSLIMDDGEDILENDDGDLNEFVADSLELNDGVNDDGSQVIERSKRLQDEQISDDNTRNESSLTQGNLTKNTELLSKDFIQTKTAVKNKLEAKQRPKVDFIDQNKGNFSRKTGKSSYAALYSQKVKLKQSNANGKKGKANDSREKEKHGKNENEESRRENISLEQYDNFNESSSSFSFKRSNSSTYTNHNNSLYYNVDAYRIPDVTNYNMQSPAMGPLNQSCIPQYDSYVNQPYNVPYKDFGLRYSNHGHHSYQTSSAMAYPQNPNGFYHLPSQMQGYASQSAPPGVPHYGRKPLIDQVEFFPEHDHILSQSLTNSQFINPQQIYQRQSVLERKFVSEPHLSPSPQPLSGENATDRASKISNGTGSYSSVRQPVDYKPYTLKDYRQIKNEQFDMLGSLGPDTESEEYKGKVSCKN